MKAKTKVSKATAKPVKTEPTQSEIAQRAHELAALRNFEPGHEMDDWLQAEKELKGCCCECACQG